MSYEAYKDDSLGFTTRQLHAGYNPAEHYRAKTVPIYQTAAYELGDFDRCVRLFAHEEDGFSYARSANPTNAVLERRLVSLEEGTAALALASGMAGISGTFLNLCGVGDEIIAVKALYGGTTNLLQNILPRHGIVGRFVENPNDLSAYEALINEKTKAIFVETLSNPDLRVADLEGLSDLAHRHGLPLVVDNTFATPYLLRPFAFGADVVCYSATKYLSGHGVAIGGLVVENGKFDWLNGRFPHMEQLYEEQKTAIGDEQLKSSLFTARLKQHYLTDFGAHLSPTTAFYLLQGIETLSLRMDRHVENARQVAEFLEGHPAVHTVFYPSLSSNPYHDLATKYFPKGAGAILSIRVKGGIEAAKQVLHKVKLFDYMVNVGDAKSMIVHPASSTHHNLEESQWEAAGVYADQLRLSVGIEDAKDLIADLEQALAELV
ncbi:O-acetylhomoserine aminocarboxypropyltransferase [Clostridia bacterium]|nr:O-acetylhomoserine aminocarboxypropyltransferase [Clostridia bacterium]